jgi:glutamate/tyrosine decarboxylase-like PLP-dependent enzyme
LINKARDQSISDLKGFSIGEAFLDPEGRNFVELENALVKAVELIKLWWRGEQKHVSPRPSEDEAKKFMHSLEEQVKDTPFPVAYQQIESCIRVLYSDVRFNKSNLMNVHPSPLLPSLVASFVTMVQNPNNISATTSPATTLMEEECMIELARLVGFRGGGESRKPGGNIVSCGTISNLTALMVAREKAYMGPRGLGGLSLSHGGLFNAPRGIIVASRSAHYSIRKAARILGLGEDGVIEVPVADESELLDFEQSGVPLRLRPSKEVYAETLERIDKMAKDRDNKRQKIVSVVSTLGTINTGTIEEIQPLIDLKERFEFHLHIDAAIGGLALGLSEVKQKTQGVDLADSITIDPHKLGFVPYPCSAILFRDKSDLELISMDAPYVGSSASTIEGSRPGSNIAAFWVAMKSLGEKGYSSIIERCISLTRFLGNLLKDIGYQVIHDVDLNTICFSLRKEGQPLKKINKATRDLHARIIADGRYLVSIIEDISGIRVRDKPWLKDSEKTSLSGIKVWIMNPHMNEEDLESFIHVLEEKRKHLTF